MKTKLCRTKLIVVFHYKDGKWDKGEGASERMWLHIVNQRTKDKTPFDASTVVWEGEQKVEVGKRPSDRLDGALRRLFSKKVYRHANNKNHQGWQHMLVALLANEVCEQGWAGCNVENNSVGWRNLFESFIGPLFLDRLHGAAWELHIGLNRDKFDKPEWFILAELMNEKEVREAMKAVRDGVEHIEYIRPNQRRKAA